MRNRSGAIGRSGDKNRRSFFPRCRVASLLFPTHQISCERLRWIVDRSRVSLLVLTGLLVLTNCHRSRPEVTGPVSVRNLAEAYERSTATVRTQYDGKEITVRGYAQLAAVMPAQGADQGSVLLEDKELKSTRQVICWFSKEQSETFARIKGEQYITVRGIFNGEVGADLKFCKLVEVE